MITRLCDSCEELIKVKNFNELSIRILETNGEKDQHTKNQMYGEYCNKCINNGNAIKQLKSGLE